MKRLSAALFVLAAFSASLVIGLQRTDWAHEISDAGSPNQSGESYRTLTMDSCFQETTIKVANRDRVFTLREAGQIKLTVERYLAEEKPDLEPNVSGPGEPFIDCQGTVRMGAWILESGYSDEPELRLTFRAASAAHFMVRQEIALKQGKGQWKVVDINVVTYDHFGF